MRIAVIGTGGVGGYFGARLAAGGAQLAFIARGKQLQALQKEGLKVLSPLGDLHLKPVQATDDPASVGPVDLVVIAVKLWSTEEAVRSAQLLVGPGTAVVSFQNGVDAVDLLVKHLGRERVLGGVAHIAAMIEAPGVIRHSGAMQKLTFGELDGKRSSRVEAFLAACEQGGIEARIAQDIQQAIWEKFVFLVGLSGMTALTRLPIGPIREDPVTREMLRSVMEEATRVGRAKGIDLPPDAADRQLAFADDLPWGMISSMLGDLQRGNRLELPWLSGAVVRLGKELGVPTPRNEAIYAALKLYAEGRPAAA